MSDYDNIVPVTAYKNDTSAHITDEKDEKYGGGDVSTKDIYQVGN